MTNHSKDVKGNQNPQISGITEIVVSGYKSIRDEVSLQITPLTLLAGANSSGKSSFMQPILLLKQTLEASYDPGALLLNGPIVRFTSVDDLFWHAYGYPRASSIKVGIRYTDGPLYTMVYGKQKNKAMDIIDLTISNKENFIHFNSDMPSKDVYRAVERLHPGYLNGIEMFGEEAGKLEAMIIRDRSFFKIELNLNIFSFFLKI